MSETLTPAEPEAVVAEDPVEMAPVEQEVTEPTEPEAEQPETVAIETPEEPEKPKVKREDRRFANLSARTASLEQELAEERRARQAAEALIKANATPEQQPAAPSESVEAAAHRLVAQREFESRRLAVVAEGTKEFGEQEWVNKTNVLHSMGATGNQDFLTALMGIPNAPQLVSELADDTDTLVSLLNKPPVAMAAEMGRMAAKIETRAAPAPKPVSSAPRPIEQVRASRVAEPNIYDPKMTMEQYAALRAKTAPRRLGGRG